MKPMVLPETRLSDALTAGDPSTRLKAALAIGSSPEQGLVDTLVAQCAVKPNFYVRDMLTWALTRFPSEITLPKLRAELLSERPRLGVRHCTHCQNQETPAHGRRSPGPCFATLTTRSPRALGVRLLFSYPMDRRMTWRRNLSGSLAEGTVRFSSVPNLEFRRTSSGSR